MRIKLVEYFTDDVNLTDFIDETDFKDYFKTKVVSMYGEYGILEMWVNDIYSNLEPQEQQDALEWLEIDNISKIDTIKFSDYGDEIIDELLDEGTLKDDFNEFRDEYISENAGDLQADADEYQNWKNDPWRDTGMSEKDFI